MDPDATLIELRDLTRCIQEAQDNPDFNTEEAYRRETGRDLAEDAVRLAELVAALDQWITRGGFLPAGWQLAQRLS